MKNFAHMTKEDADIFYRFRNGAEMGLFHAHQTDVWWTREIAAFPLTVHEHSGRVALAMHGCEE